MTNGAPPDGLAAEYHRGMATRIDGGAGAVQVPGPPPRPVPPWGGPSILELVLGSAFGLALFAAAAGAALGPCTDQIDAMEKPGEPAVVVAVEVRFVGKSRYGFADLRARDGTMWTAKGDDEVIGAMQRGRTTTLYRDGALEQGSRHPRAWVAEDRADQLPAAHAGRGILLFGIVPLIVVVGSLASRYDIRRRRLWATGVVAEGTILHYDGKRGHRASYRFRTASGEIVDGSFATSPDRFRQMGGPPAAGMAAWILHASDAPKRSLLYAVDPSRTGPTLPIPDAAREPSAGAKLA